MDQVFANTAVLGLLVFLFAAIERRNPDERLRCWVAGWISILIHFALKLWTPTRHVWQVLEASLSVDTLGLAAIFFAVSTMITRESRKAGFRLGGLLALLTLPCLTLAIVQPHAAWLLFALVILRQVIAILLAVRARKRRRAISALVLPLCVLSLVWMLYGLRHGDSDVVVIALLGEMFLVTAIDFWFNGWGRALALRVTCAGLVAWGAVFPSFLLVERFWPHIPAGSEIWNVPKFCVAVGMILMVLEEDARSARRLTEEYRISFETNPHPLWIFDTETLCFLAVNHAALYKHGYTREEFLSLKLPKIIDASQVPSVLEQVACPMPTPNRASLHIRKDGSVMPMDITAHDIVFQGRPARFILGIDVSEREELRQQALHYSRHDILTGLPNRLLFEEQLKDRVTRAVERNEKIVILCIDVDRFKRINDIHGTRIGDECLKQVASLVRSKAGPMDLVARTAGDEFTLVLTELRSAVPAKRILAELRGALSEPIEVMNTKVHISFSAGLASCPDDGIDAGSLWRCAETALSQARAEGAGQTVWTSPELRSITEQQVELEVYMRTQLERGGFQLAYQPLYGMDGSVQRLEALLRLSCPDGSPISPSQFIPVAEEAGLILPIGDWVIEEACRQFRAWQHEGVRPVPIALNVSGLQLMQKGFAERVISTLLRFDISPEWIELEVTESTAMLNLTEVSSQMALLAAYGIRFSIDDFGTGHSSLNRLDQLPLSVLKVDRSFTERLFVAGGTRSIVEAIISMAKALKMHVVAEGVETEEQVLELSKMGCDYLQGFLLSQPLEPQAIPPLMQCLHPCLVSLNLSNRVYSWQSEPSLQ